MFLYLVVALLLIYFWFKKKFEFWQCQGFPFIPASIPFGSTTGLGFKVHTSDLFKKFYDDNKEKHSAVGFYFLTTPVLLPTSPELIKEILLKNFDSFRERGFYHNFNDDPLSRNLFLVDGSYWKNMRARMTPTFTSGRMKMMFENVSTVCDGMIDYLKPTADASSTVEMKEVLASLTTEIIASVAFGLDVKCIGNPTSEFRVIANKLFNPPVWRALKLFFMNSNQDFSRQLGLTLNDRQTIKFFSEMVKRTIDHRKKNNVMRQDYLQLLIQLKESDRNLSIDEIVANCFMFFLAGQ